MPFTNVGKSGVALAIGSLSSNRPQYLGIGSGSGIAVVTDTGLTFEMRRDIPTTTDVSTEREITYTGDWNSIQMSGADLREFGTFTNASAGTAWNREEFPVVSFDGTNELQIQLKFKVF